MNGVLARLPNEVANAEREYIEAWRRKTGRADGRELTGLALSGGGIRSGVFCLGVLQALAKHDALKILITCPPCLAAATLARR